MPPATRRALMWTAIVVMMAALAGAATGQARRVPAEVLRAITDDDPYPLPRGLAAAERGLPLAEPDPTAMFAPPTGNGIR